MSSHGKLLRGLQEQKRDVGHDLRDTFHVLTRLLKSHGIHFTARENLPPHQDPQLHLCSKSINDMEGLNTFTSTHTLLWVGEESTVDS